METSGGSVRVVGTDRAISFKELARRAQPGAEPLAASTLSHRKPRPIQRHASGEVEIDPETGAVALVDYVVVDDFGMTLNPLLLAGQVHGGAVQGIGRP